MKFSALAQSSLHLTNDRQSSTYSDIRLLGPRYMSVPHITVRHGSMTPYFISWPIAPKQPVSTCLFPELRQALPCSPKYSIICATDIQNMLSWSVNLLVKDQI